VGFVGWSEKKIQMLVAYEKLYLRLADYTMLVTFRLQFLILYDTWLIYKTEDNPSTSIFSVPLHAVGIEYTDIEC